MSNASVINVKGFALASVSVLNKDNCAFPPCQNDLLHLPQLV